MKYAIVFVFIVLTGLGGDYASCDEADFRRSAMMLTNGWRITQDVRDLGELNGWYKVDFKSDWQPIERLAHLQLLLAQQPYFGRDLRYFNDSPWWYRLEFSTKDDLNETTLRFYGVDYFAKVWLNGTLLGEHEGYADPFEFEVGKLLRKDRPNVLVVKVSSPWDHKYADPALPAFSVVRNLMKGSYEHADGFVQRDVNPVGIWRPVKLIFHGPLRETGTPSIITSMVSDQSKASVKTEWPIFNASQSMMIECTVHIRLLDTNKEVATSSRSIRIEHGANDLSVMTDLDSPKVWTTWDRGRQPLYEAALEIAEAGSVRLVSSATFGIRTVELHRTKDETRFSINGNPIYLRGTSYWPDLYLSKVSRSRYERDAQAAIRAGINAFRVHVHTENPEFYDVCDRLGIVVIQDNDLNWVFPTNKEFLTRAMNHFGTLVRLLRNHPSVIAWIAMNEVSWGEDWTAKQFDRRNMKAIGTKLNTTARTLDPTRPVIEDSGMSGDPASGDVHDYRGSLITGGSTYFDVYHSVVPGNLGGPPKLVTEFGVDAPPDPDSLHAAPKLAQRLIDVSPKTSELQDYQYHLLKYYIEYYRIHKYSPNAGYFQFMWIDFSPQSFYGVYDYWGNAKSNGLGGGLQAMLESNQPVGIFMEHDSRPHALHAVNDSSVDLGSCWARWRVSTPKGVVDEGSQLVQIGPDSHQRIRDFDFVVKGTDAYTVTLELVAADGIVLARNKYVNAFNPQPRPRGYPERLDEELGMRLWWAN